MIFFQKCVDETMFSAYSVLMKIKTEIEIDELVTLRLAMNSLQSTLNALEKMSESNAIVFRNDKENLENARKVVDNLVKRS